MISKELYNNIQNVLGKKGINAVVGNIYDLMDTCLSWYRGNVNDFHHFDVKMANGNTKNVERHTMNLPKKICEDFSRLLWSEKVQINLDTELSTQKLWEILKSNENNFMVNFPNFLERVFCLGTGVTVPYKKNGKIVIDFIDGDLVIPYKYTNSYINGLITVSREIEETNDIKKYYTLLTYHEFENNQYIKFHELYLSNDSSELGDEIELSTIYSHLKEHEIIETENPRFQVWKPLIANNFDNSSPMGLSVLANHIDKFKSIDIKYDSFSREFVTGKKRILVDRTAIKEIPKVNGENVEFVTYFDTQDEVYVAISGMEHQPIKEIDFKLRYQEHITSINADLNYLSAGVGLGQNFYKFDGQGLKTATEVVSENSDTYRTKVHHQIMVEQNLVSLIKAICEMENIPCKSVNVVFDDSIIEDENALINRGIQLYTNKTISLEKFMSKYLHYEDSEIQKEMEKIQNENKIIQPEGMDFFGVSESDNKKK